MITPLTCSFAECVAGKIRCISSRERSLHRSASSHDEMLRRYCTRSSERRSCHFSIITPHHPTEGSTVHGSITVVCLPPWRVVPARETMQLLSLFVFVFTSNAVVNVQPPVLFLAIPLGTGVNHSCFLENKDAPSGTDTVVPSLRVSVDPSCSARTLTGNGRLTHGRLSLCMVMVFRAIILFFLKLECYDCSDAL